MSVADKTETLVITGNGDVLQPEDGVAGIGSGGNYALAAARALMDQDISAEDIARTIHAHPTLPEAVMEAAEAVHSMAVHIYQKPKH